MTHSIKGSTEVELNIRFHPCIFNILFLKRLFQKENGYLFEEWRIPKKFGRIFRFLTTCPPGHDSKIEIRQINRENSHKLAKTKNFNL